MQIKTNLENELNNIWSQSLPQFAEDLDFQQNILNLPHHCLVWRHQLTVSVWNSFLQRMQVLFLRQLAQDVVMRITFHWRVCIAIATEYIWLLLFPYKVFSQNVKHYLERNIFRNREAFLISYTQSISIHLIKFFAENNKNFFFKEHWNSSIMKNNM